jgi:Putative prokaryotic signal transducing protein
MTQMVQVAIAGDVTEAEELEAILREVGIDTELESAVDHHPSATDDVPTKVLVPASQLEAAQEAIEAMSEPDELISDA